jgi:putative CocE/NonD family hydrolase
MGLHAGGWHDLFLKGSIKNYTGLHQQAATAEARAGQRLIVGPWAHAPTSPAGKVGDVVFGKDAVLDNTSTTLKWFDYSLKGVRNEFSSGAPVRLFIMGNNVWRDEQEFPLARTRYTKFYFHSTRGANGVAGDGSLSVTPPAVEKKISLLMTRRILCRRSVVACVAAGASTWSCRSESERNALRCFGVFDTAADRRYRGYGYISVELYASTSAVDTDFTALLVDVDESGYARFLTDGIVRARYRESTKEASAITPVRSISTRLICGRRRMCSRRASNQVVHFE